MNVASALFLFRLFVFLGAYPADGAPIGDPFDLPDDTDLGPGWNEALPALIRSFLRSWEDPPCG